MPSVRKLRHVSQEPLRTPKLLVDDSDASLRAIKKLAAAKVRFRKVVASVHDQRTFRIPAVLSVLGLIDGPMAVERFLKKLRLANGVH